MNQPIPILSVVIPTLGRPTLIPTLESLVRTNRFGDLEVIVAGTIADGDVKARLEWLMGQYPNVRWLQVSFPQGDSSRKKNAGFQASRSDVVAFLDDDVVVDPDWPERIRAPFSENPKVGLVSGPGLVPNNLPPMAKLAGHALASKAAGYVAQRYTTESSEPQPVKWSRLIGCNMAYRRSVLEEIGLFNPRFWPGEEMLAAYEATRRGYMLIFQPRARVYHYPRHTLWQFLRQMYGYGATRIRLIRAGVEFEPSTIVPMLWVLSLVILVPLAFISRLALVLLGADIALYALADVYITLHKMRDTRDPADWGLLWLVPLMHLSYGFAEWVELLRPNRDLSEKGPR